jgi:hypothetical protein
MEAVKEVVSAIAEPAAAAYIDQLPAFAFQWADPLAADAAA